MTNAHVGAVAVSGTNIFAGTYGGGVVSLIAYDLLGREVATLVNEIKRAGVHTVRFDASGLSSGMYFYRLQAGTFVETKRLLLIR